ncbi:MAG TPA: complex I subunit 5 family protein, partial [bacterium]|nr:complex I subunit 5 family protein [bacterium]
AGVSRLAGQPPQAYRLGGWDGLLGLMLRLDGLSTFFLIVIAAVSLCAGLFSVSYMTRYTSKHRYYALLLLLVAALNGLVLTGDLFSLYIFLELATLVSCALVAFGTGKDEIEAAFKYFVLGTLASLLILLGIAVLYGVSGTVNMAALARVLRLTVPLAPALLALALLLAGFCVKAALVPFHAWLPDAHPAAPAPISAMLSGVFIKVAGFYALLRLLYCIYGMSAPVALLLKGMGVCSMLVGIILALQQKDLKRMLAYSTVSQAGYLAVAAALNTSLGLLALLLHIASHAAAKSLLFLNAGAVEYATGTRNIRELGGLHRRMPLSGLSALVGGLSLAGVPPLAGFWSKLLIILACVMAGAWVSALTATVVSMLTLLVVLRMQRQVWFGLPRAAALTAREVPAGMIAAQLLLMLVCVVLGFWFLSPGLNAGVPWAAVAALSSLAQGGY